MRKYQRIISWTLVALTGLVGLVNGCNKKTRRRPDPPAQTVPAAPTTPAENTGLEYRILSEEQELFIDTVRDENEAESRRIYKIDASFGSYAILQEEGNKYNGRIHYFLREGTNLEGIPTGKWICVAGQNAWTDQLEKELKEKIEKSKTLPEGKRWN